MDSDDLKWREDEEAETKPNLGSTETIKDVSTNNDATTSNTATSNTANPDVLADITIKNHQTKTKKNHLQLSLIAGFVVVLIIMIVTLLVINNIRTGVISEPSESQIEEGYEEFADGDQITSEEISAGTFVVKVGGKEITYRAAYLIDGRDVTIYAGKYESTTEGEAVFLVVNGGKLRIEAGTEIAKSTSDTTATADILDNDYGINSAIIVIGENSSAEIVGTNIGTNAPNSNAVVAVNKAQVSVVSSAISTEGNSSHGLYTIFNGAINADDVTITTSGANAYPLASFAGPITAINMGLKTDSSPLIYSDSSVTITDSVGTSGSEQIIMSSQPEFITQNNCDFNTK